MIQVIMQGGPFMVPIILLFFVVMFISIKNIKDPFYTNSIILTGILTALIGIVATYAGISNAFATITLAGSVSAEIILNGFSVAMLTTYSGGLVLFVSVLSWYYFIKKHNLYVV